MKVILSFETGEIREITDTLSLEVTKNKLTCLGSIEFHSVDLNTVNNIRIADGLELHALFNYLDRVDEGEFSDAALLGYLENEVVGWNTRNKASLNPSNTVKTYLAWVEKR